MKTTYETNGDIRGNCGHKHRTIQAALRCAQRDHNACNSHGGYSDRQVIRTDGRPLDDWDIIEIEEGF